MGGSLFPGGGWIGAAGLAGNLLYNAVVVQFVHRWWAWVVFAAVAAIALSTWRRGDKRPAGVVAALVVVQIALGIATLLSGVALPIAVAHQAVAALLLGALVWCAHRLGRLRSYVVL